MKIIFLLLMTSFLLSSCFNNNPENINDAKKDMGIIKNNSAKKDVIEKEKNDLLIEEEEEELIDNGDEKNQIEEPKQSDNIKIEYIDGEKFLELNSLSYSDFIKGEAEISGITLENIDKIDVSFINENSEFPNDLFTLKQFKPGDKSFVYRAYTKYRVLDFGINEYIFTAYSGKKTSKLRLTVKLIKDEKKEKKESKKKLIKIEDFELPTGEKFGNPISIGNNKYTYSDISGLEIKKFSFYKNIECENITDFLTKKMKSWFYWNTCRNIVSPKNDETTKGISVYVISLEGENYIYEKHYLDFNQGLYGTYEIEKGDLVNKENIGEKNNELKKKNDDIMNIEIIDNLFKEIVK